MPVEFVGMIGTRPASELDGPSADLIGGSVDPQFVRDFSRAHEERGFDQVLIGYAASSPDGVMVASHAAQVTDRLQFMIAHRPGFVAPTLAARKFATLDHFSTGRITLNVITGGSDSDQQRDGDWLGKEARYRRTEEYLQILRAVWSGDQPFDHEGEFYRLRGAYSEVKPYQRQHIPLYFGGASEAAVGVAARQSDVYMMWGEPLAQVKERIDEARTEAAKHGRVLRFSLSTRPILGPTEEKAWQRAHAILERIVAVRGGRTASPGWASEVSVGSQRLLATAARGELHDKRLWTPIATATGAGGNSTALVGTPEQVAEALLAYYDLGVTTLLVRGFYPYEDAVDYGRDLIPIVRAEVARRERETVATH